MKIADVNKLFDTEHTIAKELFEDCEKIYEIIPQINDSCRKNAKNLAFPSGMCYT